MAIGSSALSGATAGAGIGTMLGGPVGTAVGAGVGGLVGAASGWLSQRDKNKPMQFAQQLAREQRMEAMQRKAQASEMGRPVMDAEVNQLKSMYNLAQQGIPDAQRQLAERDIQRGAQDAIAASSGRGGSLNTISQISQSVQDANVGLAAQDAQLAQQGMLKVGNQLAGAMGRQEQFNEISPYQELIAEAQALEASGIQNQFLTSQLQAQRGAERQENFEKTMGGITDLATSGGLGTILG